MSSKVVEQGRLGDGLAYFRVGAGRPLIYLPGLTTHHRPPHGMDLRFQASQLTPFARHREVWWVQRKEGLAPGTTMTDIARDYAAALGGRFEGPVDVVGSSTGGSVALQLAADHPGAVRRLVLLSSACRLGESGRAAQRSYARLLRQGRTRQANALMMSMLAAGELSGWLLARLGWMLGLTLKSEDGFSDMLAIIEAEDAFDLTDQLRGITTPTLVVGGAKDRFYGADVFRETASGLPSGRLLLYPTRGHAGTQTGRTTTTEVLRFLDSE